MFKNKIRKGGEIMSWNGSFVPMGNKPFKKINKEEEMNKKKEVKEEMRVEETINFYLISTGLPLLPYLDTLQKWVKGITEVKAEIEGGIEIRGFLESVDIEELAVVINGRKFKIDTIIRISRLKPRPAGWGIE